MTESSSEEIHFIARCGHKFHEQSSESIFKINIRCKQCGIKFFKSKDIEAILLKALEQKNHFYDEIFALFEYIENNGIGFGEIAIREAINLGFDLSSLNETLKSMLTLFCKDDSVRKFTVLMDLGLKVKPEEEMGKFLWDMALKNESLNILEMMKGLGFDPKTVDASFATKHCVTRWLFKNGYKLNTKIGNCYQIHLVVLHKDLELVKFLLRKGADINIKDDNGLSPFHRFVQELSDDELEKRYSFMSGLVYLGADIESVNNDNETPLYTALKNKKTNLIGFLLSKNAYANNPKVKEFGSILFYVLGYENGKCRLEKFLSTYPNINETDSQGQNVLHKLLKAKKSDYSIANLVIELGASVIIQDKDGNTPLHILGFNSEKFDYFTKDIVKFLIRNGANIYSKNKKGELAITTFIRWTLMSKCNKNNLF